MSKKWTKQKLRETIEILQRHTDYKAAVNELGETKDSIYNAFSREGLNAPSEYLASSKDEIKRRQEMQSSGKLETILIGNDFHFPFHNKAGCRNFLKFATDLQPDHLIINGDFLDCYSISRFNKVPGMPDLQAELDVGLEYLQSLRNACPTAKMTFLEGNHEKRLQYFVEANHGFYGLRCIQLENLLHFKDFEIDFIKYGKTLDFHGGVHTLSITHGHKARKHSAYSAKGHLFDEYYANIIHGHTHRLGSYYQSGKLGVRRAFENGGLFDKKQADYITGEANWQNGFSVVYMSPEMSCNGCGQKHEPEYTQIVPIEMADNGSFIWKGTVYGG